MAMYAGNEDGWISDFIQPRQIWPHKDYEDIKPSYIIYRYKDK